MILHSTPLKCPQEPEHETCHLSYHTAQQIGSQNNQDLHELIFRNPYFVEGTAYMLNKP